LRRRRCRHTHPLSLERQHSIHSLIRLNTARLHSKNVNWTTARGLGLQLSVGPRYTGPCGTHPAACILGVESSASSHRNRTVARRNIMATGSPPYNVRIERTRHINAPVGRVTAVLEDTARAPEWNPLLDKMAPTTLQGRGLHSSLTWEARVAGVPLSARARRSSGTAGSRTPGSARNA
jgi:hypothetical protein